MSFQTPGGANASPADSLDASGDDFMELDTPRNSTTNTNTGNRRSSRIANNQQTPNVGPNNSFSNNNGNELSSHDMGPPPPNAPSAPSSQFRLGQPPLPPPHKGTQNKNQNQAGRDRGERERERERGNHQPKNKKKETRTGPSLIPTLLALRRQVHVAMYEQSSPLSAIYFADALCTLSQYEQNDVILLGNIHF
jgi:hypothetical protein